MPSVLVSLGSGVPSIAYPRQSSVTPGDWIVTADEPSSYQESVWRQYTPGSVIVAGSESMMCEQAGPVPPDCADAGAATIAARTATAGSTTRRHQTAAFRHGSRSVFIEASSGLDDVVDVVRT